MERFMDTNNTWTKEHLLQNLHLDKYDFDFSKDGLNLCVALAVKVKLLNLTKIVINY